MNLAAMTERRAAGRSGSQGGCWEARLQPLASVRTALDDGLLSVAKFPYLLVLSATISLVLRPVGYRAQMKELGSGQSLANCIESQVHLLPWGPSALWNDFCIFKCLDFQWLHQCLGELSCFASWHTHPKMSTIWFFTGDIP